MRRWTVILAFLALLVALTAIVIIAARQGCAKVVMLPDGTRIELLGTEMGTKVFTTEKPLHKRLRKILPVKWQTWLPSPISGSCGSSSNTLTVYLQVTQPPGAPVNNNTPWQYRTTRDKDGFIHNQEGGYCSFGGTIKGSTVYGLSLRAFPRRDAQFQFELLNDKSALQAAFEIENPAKGPFPTWTPVPLPVTLTNGPVTLTLQSFSQTGKAPNRYIRPAWKLTSTDPKWRKAKAGYANLIDATGNEGQWLSTREPAWKLQTKVFRERLQDFEPAEFFTITNIPVPAPGEHVFEAASVARNGVLLTVAGVAGRGEIARTNNGPWQMTPNHPGGSGYSSGSSGTTTWERRPSMKPFLLLETAQTQPNDEIRLEIVDDQNRAIKANSNGYSGTGVGKRIYMWQFDPQADAKSLTFTVIVNRPLEFEYVVNPADLKAPKP